MPGQGRRRGCVAVCGGVLALALLATPAAANMANPFQEGDQPAEPIGSVREVAIDREVLRIDLRPLERGEPAEISAVYAVRNPGPARPLDLAFIAPGLSGSGVAVTLDGAAVASRPEVATTLPDAWQSPRTTPALGDGQPMSYQPSGAPGQTLRFGVTLPEGSHALEVRYQASASSYTADSPTRYWQLAYVLAPARDWASFGSLDVAVQVPAGWDAATSLPLQRNGDVLAGQFTGVPSDALGITTRLTRISSVDPGQAILLGDVLAVAAATMLARWLARRGRSRWWALPVSVVLALVPATALVLAVTVWSGIPDSQSVSNYGTAVAIFLGAPFIWLVTVVLCEITVLINGRKSRRFAPNNTATVVP